MYGEGAKAGGGGEGERRLQGEGRALATPTSGGGHLGFHTLPWGWPSWNLNPKLGAAILDCDPQIWPPSWIQPVQTPHPLMGVAEYEPRPLFRRPSWLPKPPSGGGHVGFSQPPS